MAPAVKLRDVVITHAYSFPVPCVAPPFIVHLILTEMLSCSCETELTLDRSNKAKGRPARYPSIALVLYTPNRQPSRSAPFVKIHTTPTVKLRSCNPNRYRACEKWMRTISRNGESVSRRKERRSLSRRSLSLEREDAAALFIVSLEARTKFVRTCSTVTDSASESYGRV